MKLTVRDIDKAQQAVNRVVQQSITVKQEPVKLELPTKLVIVVQDWFERERGFGIRPDGCSLHLTKEDLSQHIKEYWDSMKAISITAPYEYSSEDGLPYAAEVADPVLIKELLEKEAYGYGNFQKVLSALYDSCGCI